MFLITARRKGCQPSSQGKNIRSRRTWAGRKCIDIGLAPNTQAALRIREYIDANYTRPQNYNTYRRIGGLSTSHLCQLFASVFGRPPFAYLVNLRLQHACRLLRETDLSVKEVAYAVGIPDPNYFSRLFRRHFRCSPSEWCHTMNR